MSEHDVYNNKTHSNSDPAEHLEERDDDLIAITLMSGPQDGKTMTWPKPDDNEEMILTIGRRDGCDITLNYDTQVSRLHARIIYEPLQDMYYLEDAQSRNGTFIANVRIDGRMPLSQGELFKVGRTWMRIDPPRRGLDDTAAIQELPY